jgi:hypothetical protein
VPLTPEAGIESHPSSEVKVRTIFAKLSHLTIGSRSSTVRTFVSALPFLAGACFPTYQSARIDPGFRIDASAVVLGDHGRDASNAGTDVIGMVTPAYGFGGLVEIGLPIGVYAENGLFNSGPLNGDRNSLLLMPYLKLALLDPKSLHDLSMSAQASLLLPANVGVRYGRDLGSWEPQIGVTYIFSGGLAGDDPTITRYQEDEQTMWAFSAGATLNGSRRLAFELGLLRNKYSRVTDFTPQGEVRRNYLLYDLYAGMRISLKK